MISLPTIQDKPQSIKSVVGIGNKSAGWLKAAMADPNLFRNHGLLRDRTAGRFQPDPSVFKFPAESRTNHATSRLVRAGHSSSTRQRRPG